LLGRKLEAFLGKMNQDAKRAVNQTKNGPVGWEKLKFFCRKPPNLQSDQGNIRGAGKE